MGLNAYVTGRMKEEEGKPPVFQVAIAVAGKLFKADLPDETTPAEALAKALNSIRNYCQKHPSVYGKYGGKDVSVHQTLVPHDILFREPVHQAWQQLAEAFGKNTAPFANALDIKDYIYPQEIEKRIFDRIDGKDKSYRFMEGDLVIGRRGWAEDETPEQNAHNRLEFEICARVVSVDRQADTVLLDRYQKRGELSLHSLKQTLSEMELNSYYEPMKWLEVIEFRDGLGAMLQDPTKSRKLDDKDMTMKTFELVCDKAEQLAQEAEQLMEKKDSQAISDL